MLGLAMAAESQSDEVLVGQGSCATHLLVARTERV